MDQSIVSSFNEAVCSQTCNNPVWIDSMTSNYKQFCPQACNFDARQEYEKLRKLNPALPKYTEEIGKYYQESADNICERVCKSEQNAVNMCSTYCGGMNPQPAAGTNLLQSQVNPMYGFGFRAPMMNLYPSEAAIYGGRSSPVLLQQPYPTRPRSRSPYYRPGRHLHGYSPYYHHSYRRHHNHHHHHHPYYRGTWF